MKEKREISIECTKVILYIRDEGGYGFGVDT